MVHMDSLSDDEELNSNDSTKSGNYASHNTNDSNSIILHPFAHQVGGHTQLLTFDKSTLCKPLIPRELLFYLNVPKELAKFVPSYKGVVQIRETGQGTYPSVVYQPMRSPKSPYNKYRPRGKTILRSGYHSEDDEDSSQSVTDSCSGGGSPFELRVQIRPFSDEKVLKKNLSQDNLLRADYISRPNERYLLLLENVASKYQLPCILDLKMGTRQHGDDATEEKRHRQIAKCQASTSASLGVRLCGMQVYQVDYGGFLWYDKYYGRKMDENGLKRALHQYFQNGTQLNEDIIDDVIDRLKLLSNAVEKSPSFRFYGTSLLIIHEGCTSNNNLSSKISNKRCPVDVRLIDFAHTICDYTNTSARSSSSPSVLTKSSSAEQLSSSALADTTQPSSTITTGSTSANITNQAIATTIKLPATTTTTVDDSKMAAIKTTTLNDVELAGIESGGCERDFVDLNSNSTIVVQRANRSFNEVVKHDRKADTADLVEDDAENHYPGSPLKSARPVVPIEQVAINNNNIIMTKDNNEFIHSNNNNNNIATTKILTKQSMRQKYPYHHPHHLETLREVDHQISTSEHPTSQTEVKCATDGTTTAINDNNNAVTAPVTCKQISSTPTTPPSLASRKISKTSIGPDKGLLFGLENLMRLLDDLKSETLITTC